MARIKKTSDTTANAVKKEEPVKEPVKEPIKVIPPIEPAVLPSDPVEDTQASFVKKKRIRVRKKATKKLSAAILCANPALKRFI